MGLRLPSPPLGFRRLTVSMLPGRQYRHRRRVRYHAHREQHLRMQCIIHRLMHSVNRLDGLERPECSVALHQDSHRPQDPRGQLVQDPGGVLVLRVTLVLRVAPRRITSSRGVLVDALPTCNTATIKQCARLLKTNLVMFILTTSGSIRNRRVDGLERQCTRAHLHRPMLTRPHKPTRTKDTLTRGQDE